MSAVKQGCGANKTVRQHIVEEQGGYCLDAARVEEQLRYDSPDVYYMRYFVRSVGDTDAAF